MPQPGIGFPRHTPLGFMTPKHHNPGRPVTLKFPQETITAFSIAALSTYALVPELNCAFDMGDCILEAVAIPNVFITHAHGDHTRCLLRHDSLRRLMGMEQANYYVPEENLEGFKELARAWKFLENVGEKKFTPPRLHALKPGGEVWLHKQLVAKAFPVLHTLPSLGYTLYDVRKKLKPEYQGKPGQELAKMRKEGVAFEDEIWVPRITFIGDSTIETLYQEPHIGKSRILFLELTFLLEDERELAKKRGHTHLDDLLEFLEARPDALENEHIILKHFSMRYTRHTIQSVLNTRLPKSLLERVHILV